MRKIHSAIASLICTTVLALSAISVLHAQETSTKPDVKAKVETKDGLETVAFDTINGMVQVNLPDDMAASDTISGTVVTEPKSENKEEIASNQDELNGYVVEIVKTKEVKEPVAKQGETPGAPVISEECPHVKPKKDTPSGFTCGIAPTAATVLIALISPKGDMVCQQEVPCKAKPPAKPTTCVFPPQGTCGKPLQIKGPCDGRSANSTIKIKGTNCPVLAESPRQQICKPPKGCVGTGAIERNEAGKITRGTITMHPAPGSTQVANTGTPTAKSQGKKGRSWKRTGPFIEKIANPATADPHGAIDVSNNTVTWTRSWPNPKDSQQRDILTNTLTFDTPPEQVSTGDEFDITISLSGSEQGPGPQVSCSGASGRMSPTPSIGSAALHNSAVPFNPTLKTHFKVKDEEAEAAPYLKTHPELAGKLAEILRKPGVVQIYAPALSGYNLKIKWLYVPQF